jgi:hypothetical protein
VLELHVAALQVGDAPGQRVALRRAAAGVLAVRRVALAQLRRR